MRKGLMLSAVAAVGFLAAGAAQATTTIPVSLDDDTGGFFLSVKNSFSYDFKVTLDTAGLLTASLTSSAVTNPIHFTSVTLNGHALTKDPTSNSYYLSDPLDVLAGIQVLHVAGTASSKATTFSGTFQYITAVPEPAAWTMMLVGFGALGLSMRRKRAVSVRYA
jgi:hypothetical protein